MDKQIIIDGVDVSGCKHYEAHALYDLYDCNETCEINGVIVCTKCKDNPNCYYKQLKRKEQEYEDLRQYHNKCCEEFEREKQNLIDKYNQFSKDFFIGKYCKKEYCELLQAKERECERLKKEIAFGNNGMLSDKIRAEVFRELNNENDQLKAENIELKEELEELKEENEYNETNAIEYKQTLTEIKEIAEKIDDSDGCAYGDYDCNNCSSLEQETVCTYKVKKLILQKVSECEVGNESN